MTSPRLHHVMSDAAMQRLHPPCSEVQRQAAAQVLPQVMFQAQERLYCGLEAIAQRWVGHVEDVCLPGGHTDSGARVCH
jgi:hypothetical protein